MKFRLLVAALVLAACPASAAEPKATFRSGGVDFELAVPAGYCLPKGPQIEVAELVAAGDKQNVTHLMLVPCAPKTGIADDYILLKTPVQAILATLDRQQFLKEAGAAFDSPEMNALLSSGKVAQESGQSVSEVLGTRVDLSGNLRPIGKDDVCAYLGGTMAVASNAASYRISVGMCMTVVAGRLITINWYGPDKGSTGVAELLVKAKRLAGEMSGAPAS